MEWKKVRAYVNQYCKLRDIQFKAPIIFLTAYAYYAVESYEVQAAGYLLKPYDTNKLTLLLDEILQRSVQKKNCC